MQSNSSEWSTFVTSCSRLKSSTSSVLPCSSSTPKNNNVDDEEFQQRTNRSQSAFLIRDDSIYVSGKWVSDKYIFVSSRNRGGMTTDEELTRKRSVTYSHERAKFISDLQEFAQREFLPRQPSSTSIHHHHEHENDISMKGKYLLQEALASGSFGEVKLGHSSGTNEEVAIKIVPKCILRSQEEMDSVKREIELHSLHKHPNIIELIETFEDDGAYYLVLERAIYGDLGQLIHTPGKCSSELECCQIFFQILQGLHYLHTNGIVHLDIKPRNVLCCSSNVFKICDFGGAKRCQKFTDALPFHMVHGTTGYIAPEFLLGKSYGLATDIWSAGILLFELLFEYTPFYPPSACIHQEVQFPSNNDKISDSAKDLILKMLVQDPVLRLSTLACLQHPWFSLHQVNTNS